MSEQKYAKIKKWPIRLIMLYLIISLVVYAFGVFKWKTDKPELFYCLQASYLISLYLGYVLNINKAVKINFSWERHERRILRLLPFALVVNIMMVLIDSMRSYGYASFNISGLIRNMIYGFTHLGINYAGRNEVAAIGGGGLLGGNLFTLVNLLWYFLELDAVLLGLLYFKKLRFPVKVLVVINVLEIAMYYVSVGTNIGVFRLLFAIGLFWVLRILRGDGRKRKRSKKVGRIYLIIGIVGAIVIFFFIKTMSSRGGILYWETSGYNISGIGLNGKSIFFRIFPRSMHMAIVAISSYLTQGYQGFSYALSVPWTPMFGFGQSYQMVGLISKYIVDIQKLTYQYKVEQMFHWSMSTNWASAYTWMGNDVSLFGVPIITYWIGKMLALTYKESLYTENAYSKILFYFMVVTCLFLPCNYQVVQFAVTFFALITAITMWILTSRIRLKV